jgi:hypothetical protein
MDQKVQKTTPENREEMARQGATGRFGYLTPIEKELNVPRGCDFEKIPQDRLLSAIFEVFHKIALKCAKTWFKAPLKGGLKHFSKKAKRSRTFQPHFLKKGGFCHV